MAFRFPRDSRPLMALVLASLGLTACDSAPPTAPSPVANATAPDAVTGPASSASAGTADARAAGGDTIKITQGTLALQSGASGTVTWKGSHGFRFEGRTLNGVEPALYCGAFEPCDPGETISFTATWVGSDLPGTVRLQGEEFQVGLNPPSMVIELTTSFVAPPHVSDTATVTVPFTASGSLFPGFRLTGDGHVTFTLEWQTLIGGGWAISYTSFDFGGGRAS